MYGFHDLVCIHCKYIYIHIIIYIYIIYIDTFIRAIYWMFIFDVSIIISLCEENSNCIYFLLRSRLSKHTVFVWRIIECLTTIVTSFKKLYLTFICLFSKIHRFVRGSSSYFLYIYLCRRTFCRIKTIFGTMTLSLECLWLATYFLPFFIIYIFWNTFFRFVSLLRVKPKITFKTFNSYICQSKSFSVTTIW